MFEFGSEAWIKAFQEAINNSPAYAEAAKTWEGDFCFIIDPAGTTGKKIVIYMDLWHGKCREAFQVTGGAVKTPAFVISAPESVWRKVIEKDLDAIQGLMTRQLKLQGDMIKIMKAVRAAKELVECTTKVPTRFHD